MCRWMLPFTLLCAHARAYKKAEKTGRRHMGMENQELILLTYVKGYGGDSPINTLA